MIKVLIVDDEKAIANLIDVSLTRAGYQCDCCFDGLTAADKTGMILFFWILCFPKWTVMSCWNI